MCPAISYLELCNLQQHMQPYITERQLFFFSKTTNDDDGDDDDLNF